MKFTVITATPRTTYRHFEVEADSPEEAANKVSDLVDSYGDSDGIEEIGESVGPDDESTEVINVEVIDA